jgi:hypothetical protein
MEVLTALGRFTDYWRRTEDDAVEPADEEGD